MKNEHESMTRRRYIVSVGSHESRALERQEGQESAACRKTCGRGSKRTEMIRMGYSTPRLHLSWVAPACRKNGRILLVNPLQSSRSTFSRGSLLSFFAVKEGMLGTSISVLGGHIP